MKRKILALLLAAAMLVCTFASCNNGNNVTDDESTQGECKHTFSEAWSSDAENHWHAATCEHGENKGDLAPHTDADEDGKCDICAYELGHEHTFADAWSSDETKHWHAATCTHTSEKSDEALHADDDNNGECDVCAAHVHTLDDTGFCTGCNQQIENIDETKLDLVIAAILAGYGKVASGTVDYDVIIRALDGEITTGHDVEYSLYADGIYQKRTEDSYTTEIWCKLNGSEIDAICVEKYDGEVVNAEPSVADENTLVGYYYAVSTLADGYGAEAVLKALYELSQGDSASEYTVAHDAENNKYTFSYNALIINSDTAEGEGDHADYYEVSVEFTYSDEFVLTGLSIVCDCYTNSLDNEEENDYTYDQATKTITMKDGALADTYTFAVTQTAGEKTAIDMAATDAYVPTDFELYEDMEYQTPAESITVQLSDGFLEIFIAIPEGTFINFIKDDLNVTITNKAEDGAEMTSWLGYDSIQAVPAAAGEYVLTVTYGEITKTVEITVEGNEVVGGENSFEVTTTDTYGFFDLFTFTATESGTYTFTLPAGLGLYSQTAYDAWSAPEVDFYDNAAGGATVSVELAEGATYSYYVGAITKGTWVISYELDAHEVSGGEQGEDSNEVELKIDNNAINASDVVFAYTASAAGFLKLTAGSAIMGPVTITVTVNGFNSTELALNSSVTFELGKGDKVVITVVASGYSSITAEWTDDSDFDGGDSEIVTGTYTGTDMFGNDFLTVIVTDTTVTFNFDHPMFGPSSVVADYELVDGEVVLYDENGAQLNPLAGLLVIDEDGTPISADYNGNSYTLAVAGSEGGDNDGDDDGEEGDDPGDFDISGSVDDGVENAVTVTETDISAGKLYFSMMAYNDGEYNFLSNDLFVSAVYDADGTPLERNDNWYYELTAWETYTIEIDTSWVPEAGEYTLTPEYQFPEGAQENPFWITLGEQTAANYAGNYAAPVWYQLFADATGTLTVTNLSDLDKVVIMVTAVFGNEISSVTYDPEGNPVYGNTISLDVIQGRQYFIGISADETDSAVEIAFKAEISEGEITTDGTINIPHNLLIGSNTAVVEWSAIYFAYRFEESGTLVLNTESTNCNWYVTEDLYEYVEGTDETALSIDGYEGDIVYVVVSTADWMEGTIDFTAAFKAAPAEIWYEDQVYTDGTANQIVLTENSYVSLGFNGAGQFTVAWDNTNAIVELVSWEMPNTPVENGGIIEGDVWGTTLYIYLPDYAEGTVNLTITPNSAS